MPMSAFSERLLTDNGIKVSAEFDGHRGRVVLVVTSGAVVPDVVLDGERVA